MRRHTHPKTKNTQNTKVKNTKYFPLSLFYRYFVLPSSSNYLNLPLKSKVRMSTYHHCGACNEPLQFSETADCVKKNVYKDMHNNTIVKCAGDSCGQYYKLCCTNLPENCKLYKYLNGTNSDQVQDAENEGDQHNTTFLCPECNIEGTTTYLMEYFQDFQQLELLYNVIPETNNYAQNQEGGENGMKLLEEHLYRTACKTSNSSLPQYRKKSEINLSRIQKMYNMQTKYKKKKPKAIADPSCIVGQPIRLYCTVDCRYHTGRIIDWRYFASSIACDELTTQTEYLVRFRAGVDGRKIALHRWIRLEDHAVMVGLFMIWIKVVRTVTESGQSNSKNNGNSDGNKNQLLKTRKIYSYRPAQIMLRSAFEMISVRDISIHDENNTVSVFILLIGENQHGVAKLHVNTNNNQSESQANTQQQQSVFYSVPTPVESEHVRDQNEKLVRSITLACVEYEEERRVRAWHNLDIENIRVCMRDISCITEDVKKSSTVKRKKTS